MDCSADGCGHEAACPGRMAYADWAAKLQGLVVASDRSAMKWTTPPFRGTWPKQAGMEPDRHELALSPEQSSQTPLR